MIRIGPHLPFVSSMCAMVTRDTLLSPARFGMGVTGAILMSVLLTACGGGGDDGTGVASLATTSSSGQPAAASTPAGEKEALEFISCVRANGIDVPDPTVNADGSLSLVPPGGPNGPVGNPGDFQKAIEACGQPPASLTGGLGDVDPSDLQDAALTFVKCMRGKGYDLADPDFSNGFPAGGDNPLSELDMTDPKTQADLRTCQKAFSDAGINLPGAP
jgi:hypothetical protein